MQIKIGKLILRPAEASNDRWDLIAIKKNKHGEEVERAEAYGLSFEKAVMLGISNQTKEELGDLSLTVSEYLDKLNEIKDNVLSEVEKFFKSKA